MSLRNYPQAKLFANIGIGVKHLYLCFSHKAFKKYYSGFPFLFQILFLPLAD
jgi:hypothetical protein